MTQEEVMDKPTEAQIKCPKCGSSHYYYEGFFIRCNACQYIQWAKVVKGKLENVWALWQVKEK